MPNYNNEINLNIAPQVKIARTRVPLNNTAVFDFSAGHLIPVRVFPVLPGGSYKVNLEYLIRMVTPQKPFFDNVYCDIHAFFVPDRLVWKHSEDFYTGGTENANYDTPVTYSIPQITFQTIDACSNLDYLCYHTAHAVNDGISIPGADNTVTSSASALPIRGMAKIFNDWFRDENLQSYIYFDDGDSAVAYKSFSKTISNPYGLGLGTLTWGSGGTLVTQSSDVYMNAMPELFGTRQYAYNGSEVTGVTAATFVGGSAVPTSDYDLLVQQFQYGYFLLPVNRYHDYFSSMVPAPLKGGDTLLDLSLPISTDISSLGAVNLLFDTAYSKTTGPVKISIGSDALGSYGDGYGYTFHNDDNKVVKGFANLYGGSINSLIVSERINELKTADMIYGSRYTEMLKGQFGVLSSDARLQRSEYLGGAHFNLNVSQVVQTSNGSSTDDSVGNTGALSATKGLKYLFNKSFEEHGFVFIFVSIRTEHKYVQGLPTWAEKKDRFDMYWPRLANIPLQPQRRNLIFNMGRTDTDIFGYAEPWSEYKYIPNTAAGHMNPSSPFALEEWTLSDLYSEPPTLDADWLVEPWQNLDRLSYLDTSYIFKLFHGAFEILIDAILPMPQFTIPSLGM